ncbi:pantetheine-phosphate adenylyltransferase [Candidatus Saganbacteria bacterium]|nr:pantetheine-phosphate adenylyltransferase [Candidatus Saganbacteria bacterium]
MKTAIYPGSFDPVTSGHIDIIERAVKLFDRVYVAAIGNPEKEPFFSLSERVEMLQLSLAKYKKVKVESFDGLLIDYARKKKAATIIRGLRAISDFDYEFQMALANRKLDSKIETIFLMTRGRYAYLSSSMVRQIASFGGDISGMVPKVIERRLSRE